MESGHGQIKVDYVLLEYLTCSTLVRANKKLFMGLFDGALVSR